MERRDFNIHQLTGIYLALILLCIFLSFTYAGYYMFSLVIKKNDYTMQCETYANLCIENDQINEKISIINDIELEIENRKNKYFSNIGLLEQKIINGQSDVKIAYLTFDDGPYLLTESYLDVLKQYDVRATFFVRGFTDDISLSTYRRQFEEGHTIANHTYTHSYNIIYKNADAFKQDVLKLQYLLKDKINITTNIYRFPGGSASAGGLKQSITQNLFLEGYGYVDWQAISGDGSDRSLTPQKALDNVLMSVGNQKIVVILMHDYNNNTLQALPNIITSLRERGYVLLPLFRNSIMISSN